MAQSVKATFKTRREAELAVEQLVQAHDVDRRRIEIEPQGSENSAGEMPSGSDKAAAAPSTELRDDAALEGPIVVSVNEVPDDQIEDVRKVLEDAAAVTA